MDTSEDASGIQDINYPVHSYMKVLLAIFESHIIQGVVKVKNCYLQVTAIFEPDGKE